LISFSSCLRITRFNFVLRIGLWLIGSLSFRIIWLWRCPLQFGNFLPYVALLEGLEFYWLFLLIVDEDFGDLCCKVLLLFLWKLARVRFLRTNVLSLNGWIYYFVLIGSLLTIF
jgi:hypothetical protein